jgi:hypothetical protein
VALHEFAGRLQPVPTVDATAGDDSVKRLHGLDLLWRRHRYLHTLVHERVADDVRDQSRAAVLGSNRDQNLHAIASFGTNVTG